MLKSIGSRFIAILLAALAHPIIEADLAHVQVHVPFVTFHYPRWHYLETEGCWSVHEQR